MFSNILYQFAPLETTETVATETVAIRTILKRSRYSNIRQTTHKIAKKSPPGNSRPILRVASETPGRVCGENR